MRVMKVYTGMKRRKEQHGRYKNELKRKREIRVEAEMAAFGALPLTAFALMIPVLESWTGMCLVGDNAVDVGSDVGIAEIICRGDEIILTGVVRIDATKFNYETILHEHMYNVVLVNNESGELCHAGCEYTHSSMRELRPLLLKWCSKKCKKYLKPYSSVTYFSLIIAMNEDLASDISEELRDKHFPNGSEYDKYGSRMLTPDTEPEIVLSLGKFCIKNGRVLKTIVRELAQISQPRATFQAHDDEDGIGLSISEEELIKALSSTYPTYPARTI